MLMNNYVLIIFIYQKFARGMLEIACLLENVGLQEVLKNLRD